MRRGIGIVWKVLLGIVALTVLAVAGLNVYQAMRPAARTVKAAEIIAIPVPPKLSRPFVDYMTVGGRRLDAGYSSQGMVGIIDTATNRSVAMIRGLGRVHGIALVLGRNRSQRSTAASPLLRSIGFPTLFGLPE